MVSEETESDATAAGRVDSPLRQFIKKLVTGLLMAAVLAILDGQLKGAWAPWARTFTLWVIGIIVLYLLISSIETLVPRWRKRRAAHKIEAQVRGPLLAYAFTFVETMSPSFVKGAGSVLNALHEAKALDPRATNSYHQHLGTLSTAAAHLVADVRSKRLPVIEGLQRLSQMHTDYIRLCCDIALAASTIQRSDIHRAWDEIRDHSTMISNRLSDLSTQVRGGSDQPVPHPYFQGVPRTQV